MEQERLNLYHMDMKYIRDLHNADDRVQSVSPQIHKSNRPFVGIVVVKIKKQSSKRLTNCIFWCKSRIAVAC